MMFGFAGTADHDGCVRIIHAALDRRINFLDTADVYSNGESEQIVGRALKGRRDEVPVRRRTRQPAPEFCGGVEAQVRRARDGWSSINLEAGVQPARTRRLVRKRRERPGHVGV
jgi:aryl-alcohol dehydrogenase-like predicted oxidoreductase